MDGSTDHHEVTRLLDELRAGHSGTDGRLFPLIYDELRMIAGRMIGREQSGHTLQPTALVHEAYLKLFGGQPVTARDRAHFLQIAARAMRQVLVDHARRRRAAKRGGGGVALPLESELLSSRPQTSLDIVALNIALERLASLDERQARIVELRFFADVDIRSTAETLGISPATVKRDWEVAKAWLRRELRTIDADDLPDPAAAGDARPSDPDFDSAGSADRPGEPNEE